MKENYLIAAFRKTAGTLPDAPRLNEDLDRRMAELREIYANASKAQQFHLESQILPGIAVYQTLQAVLPKEAALETVRGYIEDRAWEAHSPTDEAPGALPPGPHPVRQGHPEILRGSGRLLRQGAGRQQDLLAAGYAPLSLPRRLHPARLSGALPLLLRQRRHHIRQPAPQAPVAQDHDTGQRRQLLRLLPDPSGGRP